MNRPLFTWCESRAQPKPQARPCSAVKYPPCSEAIANSRVRSGLVADRGAISWLVRSPIHQKLLDVFVTCNYNTRLTVGGIGMRCAIYTRVSTDEQAASEYSSLK